MHDDACEFIEDFDIVRFAKHVPTKVEYLWKVDEATVLFHAVKAFQMQCEDVRCTPYREPFHSDDQFLTRVTTIPIIAVE